MTGGDGASLRVDADEAVPERGDRDRVDAGAHAVERAVDRAAPRHAPSWPADASTLPSLPVRQR